MTHASDSKRGGGLFDRLIDFRVPLNLLFVTVVSAGGFALYGMSVEEYPNVSLDQIEVQVLYPGASAVEVERHVVRKIEDEIEDVRGIEWMRSSSVQDFGRILVKVKEDGVDIERVFRDLESEVRRVIPELPEGAEEPTVTRIEVESLNPVVNIIVGGEVDEAVLRASADELERLLEAIDGVRGVDVFGRRDRELHVDVDPDALEVYDLTLLEVASALRARNVNVPSGALEGGGASLAVRSIGEWTEPHELLDTPIRTELQGGVVRLAELATVEADYEESIIAARYKGKPCLTLSVVKLGEANALSVREGVDEVTTAWQRERMPSGMELSFVADTTIRVRSRMSTLSENLGLGAVFVLLMLTFTIGFRASLLALWGVGFAFLGAFCVLRLFDQSINSLSLFGLVLVSGMLVDDAIVVLENIVRRREMGEDLRTASVEGVREVVWPVTASIATTVAAFLPLLLMTGVTGRFFAVIPIAVCAALVMSLFEVVFLLPVHVYEFGTGRSRLHAPEVGTESFGLARRLLGAVVAWTTRRRYLTLALLLLVGAGTLLAGTKLRVTFFPSEYQIFFVNLKMPPGTSLDETAAVLDRMDAELATFPKDQIASAFATAGFYYDYNYQPHVNTNYGQLMVTAADRRERGLPLPEVMRAARERLGRLQLGGASVEVKELNDGPPVGRPVTLRIQSKDLELLKRAARNIEDVVRASPGVVDVVSGLELGKAELVARIDPELAAARGASAAEVGRALAAANDGVVATRFKGPEEDWDVRVRLVPGARTTLESLGAVRIRTASGVRIPISDVAALGERATYASIERFQRERTVTITADVDLEVTSSLEANAEIERRLRGSKGDYPGVAVLYAGEFEETQKSFDSLGRAFIIALLCMYMILGAQFRSYLQPFVVLVTVPFALMGVVLSLHLMGDPLTVPVLLGVVGLAGVAVNDAIVLMDFANARRKTGMSAEEAVRTAAQLRLRPLLLTTFTTAAALLPTAIGLGPEGRSVIWGPMATAFTFGIASATVLTLVVTPALYLIGVDLQVIIARVLPRWADDLPGPSPPGGAATPSRSSELERPCELSLQER